MKKLTIILFIIISLASCTRNNGDIGVLFGTWKITSLTIDGTPDPEYKSNTFIAFQNDVFAYNPPTSSEGYWEIGKWSRDGNTLTVVYDNNIAAPPYNLHFHNGINTFTITTETSSALELSRTLEGKSYVYKLVKWD